MAWIRMIREDDAEGELAKSYERYTEPSGGVDNILKIHSLNPASMEAHYRIYAQLMRGKSGLTGWNGSSSPLPFPSRTSATTDSPITGGVSSDCLAIRIW